MAKTGPKLDDIKQEQVLIWLAAGYGHVWIADQFQLREWPPISRSTLSYYRKKCQVQITKLREERDERALKTGLALQGERVARLIEHAEELEPYRMRTARNGQLYHSDAWRATLADIAAELGGRVQRVAPTSPDGSAPWAPGAPAGELAAQIVGLLTTAAAPERAAFLAEADRFMSAAGDLAARLQPVPAGGSRG